MRGGLLGLWVGLGKVFVRAAFSHQTLCCLSGVVGFAHVQRMSSSTGIMVKECFPSWEGQLSVGLNRDLQDYRIYRTKGAQDCSVSRPRIHDGRALHVNDLGSGN